MRLYVEPMDAIVVEVDERGRVRFDKEPDFAEPTLQERRAIIYAAINEIDALQELIDKLSSK